MTKHSTGSSVSTASCFDDTMSSLSCAGGMEWDAPDKEESIEANVCKADISQAGTDEKSCKSIDEESEDNSSEFTIRRFIFKEQHLSSNLLRRMEQFLSLYFVKDEQASINLSDVRAAYFGACHRDVQLGHNQFSAALRNIKGLRVVRSNGSRKVAGMRMVRDVQEEPRLVQTAALDYPLSRREKTHHVILSYGITTASDRKRVRELEAAVEEVEGSSSSGDGNDDSFLGSIKASLKRCRTSSPIETFFDEHAVLSASSVTSFINDFVSKSPIPQDKMEVLLNTLQIEKGLSKQHFLALIAAMCQQAERYSEEQLQSCSSSLCQLRVASDSE